MWNAECGMRNVECGMWNVECGMWNVLPHSTFNIPHSTFHILHSRGSLFIQILAHPLVAFRLDLAGAFGSEDFLSGRIVERDDEREGRLLAVCVQRRLDARLRVGQIRNVRQKS